MWKKAVKTESIRTSDFMLACIILLTVIAGITNRTILFIIIGLYLLYVILYGFYNKSIGTQLQLKNSSGTIRLFPGDTGEIAFYFDNHSIFPYINGTLQFNIGESISISQKHTLNSNSRDQINIPLAIISKGKTVPKIPITAKKRGTARISNISYQFPHLFKFHTALLTYIPFYKQEVIVYPMPITVNGIDHFFQKAPGEQHATLSPFEDIGNRVGIRDYNYNDPFHRINWKASLKTQKLQTNTYEKVIDKSFVFIINIESNKSGSLVNISKSMEKYLSYAAYLTQFAAEKGYRFELFINTRNPGNIPYTHLQEGSGKSHYMHTLEMLARIHQQPMVYPASRMFYRIGRQLMKPKTIMVIGEIQPEVRQIMERWNALHQIIQVEEVDNEAILTSFRSRGKQHGTSY